MKLPYPDSKPKDFEDLDIGSLEIIKAWIDNPNQFLLIWGDPGRGKTRLACAIINWFLCFKPEKVEDKFDFIVLGDLTQQWIANCTEPKINFLIYEHLKSIPFLIIDDIGVRKPSDAFLDFFHTIIDYRCVNAMATILTTNLTKDEMNRDFSARLVSRFASGFVINLKGPDKRMKKLIKD